MLYQGCTVRLGLQSMQCVPWHFCSLAHLRRLCTLLSPQSEQLHHGYCPAGLVGGVHFIAAESAWLFSSPYGHPASTLYRKKCHSACMPAAGEVRPVVAEHAVGQALAGPRPRARSHGRPGSDSARAHAAGGRAAGPARLAPQRLPRRARFPRGPGACIRVCLRSSLHLASSTLPQLPTGR